MPGTRLVLDDRELLEVAVEYEARFFWMSFSNSSEEKVGSAGTSGRSLSTALCRMLPVELTDRPPGVSGR